jgi:hypothetical protein
MDRWNSAKEALSGGAVKGDGHLDGHLGKEE